MRQPREYISRIMQIWCIKPDGRHNAKYKERKSCVNYCKDYGSACGFAVYIV